MYSTCLHCHRSLGTNDRVERFPIGQKLAFNAANGRLWVVCASCRRWNLTPIEERWEAIEECERLYRGTRLRASTDNIGLARLAGNFDLVRVGAPQLPEIAAWRYVDEFRRRWWTTGAPLTAGAVVASSWMVMLMVAGPLLATAGGIAVGAASRAVIARRGRTRVVDGHGRVIPLSAKQVHRFRLEPAGDGWGVRHAHLDGPTITGASAVPVLRALMTARNFRGANRQDVGDAVSLLSQLRDPGQFVARTARASINTGILDYPPDVACALEIALHQDVERQALEGELSALEDEWALADEIAAIADNMLLPEAVLERHRTLKGMVS